ncbi:DMT family transporter [Angustibacter sp. McL0619]|uniref:DMT family transporter n=1 Tax=Angustibacter sp. McL0619 TaxID=3415676 RepID=UPI003CEB2868
MGQDEQDSARLTAALLAIGVVAVSFSAPIAATTAAPALAVAFWRNAFASAGVVPFAVIRRRAELRRLWSQERRVLGTAVLAGLALAVHFGLWIPSLRMTSVAASTALVTTTPLWTLGIDWARGNRPRAGVLAGVLVAFAGVLVITGVDAGSSSRQLLGDALALAGGAAAAVYTVLGSSVRRTTSTASYTAIAYSVCALALLPVCLLGQQQLVGFDAQTWAELLALTLTAQLLGHSLLNRALRTAGATTVALAILFEVPGAVIIAWAFYGQQPPVAVIPGAILVLVGLALVVRSRTTPRRVVSALEVGNVTD